MNDTKNNENTDLYSYHVFLFPFSWDYYPEIKNKKKVIASTFKSKTDLISFDKLLNKEFWQPLDFKSDLINYYNDFAFFHTSVREAIFGSLDMPNQIVRNYERKNASNGSYEISIKKNTETYRLKIEQIRLNTYDTGIGILSFFVSNSEYGKWKEVLEINDFGRRIYPQFLDTAVNEDKNKTLLGAAQDAFLAEQITLVDGKGRVVIKEDFSYISELLNEETSNPENWSLLSDELVKGLFENDKFKVNKSNPLEEEHIFIEPVLDDRMFVVTWFGNDDEANSLKPTYLDPLKTDNWMQYVFVDNSGNSCQSEHMQRQLLKEHTYDRWANYGTFYGLSRNSMVALTGSDEWVKKNLVNHIKGRYYELAQLCLAQRASCQRFSQEITNLASLDERLMKKEADFLYQEYLRFINKLYFREASPQEQGIELYRMLQSHMEIKEEVDFINSQLTDLYEFLNLKESSSQSKAANEFAWIATIFLPASFIAGVFGFSTLTDRLSFLGWPPEGQFWWPLLITLIVTGVIYFLLKKKFDK